MVANLYAGAGSCRVPAQHLRWKRPNDLAHIRGPGAEDRLGRLLDLRGARAHAVALTEWLAGDARVT